MKKIFNFSYYSFSTKVILSFFLFIIFFKFIQIILTTPKIEENALRKEIEYITKSLLITKEQIQVIIKSLRMQTELEINLSKNILENEIRAIDLQTDISKKENVIDIINKSIIPKYCSYKLSSKNQSLEKLKEEDYFSKNNRKILNEWQVINIENKNKEYRKKEYLFYNHKLNNSDFLLQLGCTYADLNPNHMNFEMDLKKHLHTKLLIGSTLDSTKTTVFWLNPNMLKNQDSILYEENEEKRKEKYTISMLSNTQNIPTGNLTLKQILDSKDTNKPITHKIDEKDVLTWIIDLSPTPSRVILLTHTIDKMQLENGNKYQIFFLVETLIAIGISFILMLFLFRRLLKNIDKLTKTAKKINQGNKNIRSNVKDDDDIGTLGKSFDSMIDFFENNIKILDKKVEEKTKEISKSLEEKEILLKEIHHRVKNNLALTISLLELQEEEIEDEKTKKVLIDIQERIYTMELLHRKLYESTNLNQISFKNYVIDLVQTIAKTYDKSKKVNITFQIEDIKLDIETALPYGLILNELITNAFKYAFDDEKEARLEIIISKQEKQILLIIKDSGKGFQKDFSKICNETLGLRLINMIIKYQLMGDIYYEYENGAKFTILGKIKEKEEFYK